MDFHLARVELNWVSRNGYGLVAGDHLSHRPFSSTRAKRLCRQNMEVHRYACTELRSLQILLGNRAYIKQILYGAFWLQQTSAIHYRYGTHKRLRNCKKMLMISTKGMRKLDSLLIVNGIRVDPESRRQNRKTEVLRAASTVKKTAEKANRERQNHWVLKNCFER